MGVALGDTLLSPPHPWMGPVYTHTHTHELTCTHMCPHRHTGVFRQSLAWDPLPAPGREHASGLFLLRFSLWAPHFLCTLLLPLPVSGVLGVSLSRLCPGG